MATATEKSFDHIKYPDVVGDVAVPVWYKGGPQAPHTFRCSNRLYNGSLVPWMKLLRYVSHTYGNDNYRTLSRIESNGFYDPNPSGSQHALGQAMDLAYIKWNGTFSDPYNGHHASTSLSDRRRYYAVDSTLRTWFRIVLDGRFDSRHTNHFHCDLSEWPVDVPGPVCRKNSKADTVFVQALCNNFVGTTLPVDGVWGLTTSSPTNTAFTTAKTKLGVSGDPHVDYRVWRRFCERAAAHGFRGVAFGHYAWPATNNYYSWSSLNIPNSFIRHRNSLGYISAPSTALDRADATWRWKTGFGGHGVSLESRNFPGYYLRHAYGRLKLSPLSTDALFRKDATFYPRNGLAKDGGRLRSLEACNFLGHYVRHRNGELWLDRFSDTDLFRRDATFSFDAPLA